MERLKDNIKFAVSCIAGISVCLLLLLALFGAMEWLKSEGIKKDSTQLKEAIDKGYNVVYTDMERYNNLVLLQNVDGATIKLTVSDDAFADLIKDFKDDN